MERLTASSVEGSSQTDSEAPLYLVAGGARKEKPVLAFAYRYRYSCTSTYVRYVR